MKTETLIQEIEACFPYVEKPQEHLLPFHKENCHQCYFLVNDLDTYKEKEIPHEGIREVYTEMSCLSAKAWYWVMPSYLRQCVLLVDECRDFTEFLIYNFSPAEEHKPIITTRLSEFNREQLNCIISFLHWCNTSDHWVSTYCPENLAAAIAFINKLKV